MSFAFLSVFFLTLLFPDLLQILRYRSRKGIVDRAHLPRSLHDRLLLDAQGHPNIGEDQEDVVYGRRVTVMTDLMTQEGCHSATSGTSLLDGAMIIDRPDLPPHAVSAVETSIGVIELLRGMIDVTATVRDDALGPRTGGIGDIEAQAREGAGMTAIRTCQFPGGSQGMCRTCRSLSLMTWIGED